MAPTRELARQLDVSRNTVLEAYERLAAEGILSSRAGAGTFVSDAPLVQTQAHQAPGGANLRIRPMWRSLARPRQTDSTRMLYDFRIGIPDPGLFPYTAWRRLVARELRPSTRRQTHEGDPSGHLSLRAAIARHIGLSRAVRAGADDVIVTTGAQQALDLIGRVLIAPDDCVAVEEPGYPAARRLFQSLGARVMGVAVDAEGVIVDAIPEAARLIYVTPSHQFPLGTAMSLPRRAALLAWAERRDGVVIEDDYDSEFRFEGRPLDPIQSLDRAGRVVYVGTFSKVLSPMLRLGFLVAPASLQPALRAARQLADLASETPATGRTRAFHRPGIAVSAHQEGGARIRGAARAHHRDAREEFRLAAGASLSGGLHLAALLTPSAAVDITRVVERAREGGVAVPALSEFCGESRKQHGLVLGYGAIAVGRIDEGLGRIRMLKPIDGVPRVQVLWSKCRVSVRCGGETMRRMPRRDSWDVRHHTVAKPTPGPVSRIPSLSTERGMTRRVSAPRATRPNR